MDNNFKNSKEIFKPVKYKTKHGIWINLPYHISNLGRVQNSKGKILKYFIRGQRKGAYPCIDLYKKGKKYRMDVHRLVALNFISNPENKSEINHLDGNCMNFESSNLEWCTRQENEIYKKFFKEGKKLTR